MFKINVILHLCFVKENVLINENRLSNLFLFPFFVTFTRIPHFTPIPQHFPSPQNLPMRRKFSPFRVECSPRWLTLVLALFLPMTAAVQMLCIFSTYRVV